MENKEALKAELEKVQAKIKKLERKQYICFDNCYECEFFERCDTDKIHYTNFPVYDEEMQILSRMGVHV